jgi:hypothetical protein
VPAKRAALAATVLVIHTALIAAAIATVYGTEKWIHFLWSDHRRLMSSIPIEGQASCPPLFCERSADTCPGDALSSASFINIG